MCRFGIFGNFQRCSNSMRLNPSFMLKRRATHRMGFPDAHRSCPRGVARVASGISTVLTVFFVIVSPLAHANATQLIDSRVTQSTLHQTICNPVYIEQVMPTFDALDRRKQELLKAQGIDFEEASDYAIEFRVPVLLGGVPNVSENVDLRRWDGTSGARRKRRLTVLLRRCVCSGELPLRRAQSAILADWSSKYTHLWGLSCREL